MDFFHVYLKIYTVSLYQCKAITTSMYSSTCIRCLAYMYFLIYQTAFFKRKLQLQTRFAFSNTCIYTNLNMPYFRCQQCCRECMPQFRTKAKKGKFLKKKGTKFCSVNWLTIVKINSSGKLYDQKPFITDYHLQIQNTSLKLYIISLTGYTGILFSLLSLAQCYILPSLSFFSLTNQQSVRCSKS